jgi:hypothetical protein
MRLDKRSLELFIPRSFLFLINVTFVFPLASVDWQLIHGLADPASKVDRGIATGVSTVSAHLRQRALWTYVDHRPFQPFLLHCVVLQGIDIMLLWLLNRIANLVRLYGCLSLVRLEV